MRQTQPALSSTGGQCLRKEPDDRYQSILIDWRWMQPESEMDADKMPCGCRQKVMPINAERNSGRHWAESEADTASALADQRSVLYTRALAKGGCSGRHRQKVKQAQAEREKEREIQAESEANATSALTDQRSVLTHMLLPKVDALADWMSSFQGKEQDNRQKRKQSEEGQNIYNAHEIHKIRQEKLSISRKTEISSR